MKVWAVFFSLLFVSPVWCAESLVLKKGDSAPYTGILSSPETIAKMRVEIEDFPARLNAAVEKEKSLFKLRLRWETGYLNTKLKMTKDELDEWRLVAIEKGTWYRSNVLWLSIGVVVGSLLSVGIVYSVVPAFEK